MSRLLVCIFALAVCCGAATNAVGQSFCPPYQTWTLECNPPGCSQQVTVYRCYGGSGAAETCGGPGCPTVTCCGNNVGYKKISCNDLCVGCQREEGAGMAAEAEHPGEGDVAFGGLPIEDAVTPPGVRTGEIVAASDRSAIEGARPPESGQPADSAPAKGASGGRVTSAGGPSR